MKTRLRVQLEVNTDHLDTSAIMVSSTFVVVVMIPTLREREPR